tara:strand:+ start:31 stop:1062 length:1032 start_codon:yes stop_codon:yes gene_type:complete
MSDSQFVFCKKTKGTSRRVAVASMLDYSGSMMHSSVRGEEGIKVLAATCLKYGRQGPAKKILAWLDQQRLAGGGKVSEYANANINAANVSASYGNPCGLQKGMWHCDRVDPDGRLEIWLSGGTGGDQLEVQVATARDHPEALAKLSGLFNRLQGQWIGANLIRSALTKCGIANWWGAFHGNCYTLKGWHDKTHLIPAAMTGTGNSTNVSAGLVTVANQLRERPEERRIALLFSDGAFNNTTSDIDPSKTLAADNRYEAGGRKFQRNTRQAIEDAWKDGIEVYYIGLQVGREGIEVAESVLGKGHAISVTNVATELPKVLEKIIGLKVADLKRTSKGEGFKVKR